MGRIWNSELSIVDVTRSAEYSCVQEFWSSCSRRNEERAVQTNETGLLAVQSSLDIWFSSFLKNEDCINDPLKKAPELRQEP